MADIERFTPDDRRGIEQLHRRTLGNEAADRLRLHWDWARRNPATGIEPPYWVVREGPTLIAVSPLTPVKVSIAGTEVAGTWSSDPLVVAERQRQGLGGSLLRAWASRSVPHSRRQHADGSTNCAGRNLRRCRVS
jgi:sensor domain CHASE-containing protein